MTPPLPNPPPPGGREKSISLIAAMAKNRVIGKDGQIPWHLSEDLKHFKETTLGHPIIMGRKTFDSLGKALPGRQNIVITRSATWQHEGVSSAHSLEEALSLYTNEKEVFIIGGAQIYTEAYPMADRLILTFVESEFEGDAFFPDFDWNKDFKIVSDSGLLHSPKSGLDFRFVTYQRSSK